MISSTKGLKTKFDIHVKYAQCENAQENEDFEWVCKHEGMSIKFEYIATGTLQ